MQNLGIAVISMVTGLIVDHYGFLILEIFFIIWLGGECRLLLWSKMSNLTELIFLFSVSLIATMVIYLYDFQMKGILNMTPCERQNHPNNM